MCQSSDDDKVGNNFERIDLFNDDITWYILELDVVGKGLDLFPKLHNDLIIISNVSNEPLQESK